jgi:uncharacterized protein YutE (UPF0331/DUF86 family)
MPIQPDDVLLNKAAIIERALRRVREELAQDTSLVNYTHIDAMTLNIQRACQAAIDMAMHIVAKQHLGMPQTSADAFRLLLKADMISKDVAKDMVAMVGFRNVAVHEYQELNMAVLKHIAENGWRSLVSYCAELRLRITS